jgi:hypothetical protein
MTKMGSMSIHDRTKDCAAAHHLQVVLAIGEDGFPKVIGFFQCQGCLSSVLSQG